MLDFKSVREKKITLAELVAGVTVDDLRRLTDEMINTMLGLMAECADADVTFVPLDPKANDTFAAKEEDKYIAWTLGHVVVHVTASSEESAALAAELARGVANHGRSRYEVPWETVTTMAQCRHRLEERQLLPRDAWTSRPAAATRDTASVAVTDLSATRNTQYQTHD